MRYLKGTRFRLQPQNQAYRDNWDAVFGDKPADKPKCDHKDCVYEVGGKWSCEYPKI